MDLKIIFKAVFINLMLTAFLQPFAFADQTLPIAPDLERQVTMAVVVFNKMDLLDYAGPKEVFSNTSRMLNFKNHKGGFKIVTVAESLKPITTTDGTAITPDFTFDEISDTEIVLVPGGGPTGPDVTANSPMIIWLKRHSLSNPIFMSVCTGAFALGQAGLLENKNATTHHMSTEALQGLFPTAHILKSRRYVLDGSILTTAGISAGIDGAFYLTSKFFGDTLANDVATMMEYTWNSKPDAKPYRK